MIRNLDKLFPLEEISHVKRIKRESFTEGTKIVALLCLEQNRGSLEHNEKFLLEYDLTPFVTQIPLYPALNLQQLEEWSNYWPVAYKTPHT